VPAAGEVEEEGGEAEEEGERTGAIVVVVLGGWFIV